MNLFNLTVIFLSLRIWCIILVLEIWQPDINVPKNIQREKNERKIKKEKMFSNKYLFHKNYKNALSVLGEKNPALIY